MTGRRSQDGARPNLACAAVLPGQCVGVAGSVFVANSVANNAAKARAESDQSDSGPVSIEVKGLSPSDYTGPHSCL